MNIKSLPRFIGTLFIVCVTLGQFNSARATILYHAENQFGPVWVYEAHNERALTFVADHSIYQSKINLKQPDIIQIEYIKMLFGSLYLSKTPNNVLLVGLGGGTFAKAINLILPHSKLDIVEINPLILPLAQKYFLFKPNNNTIIHITDGYDFIKNTKSSKYDLIILDVFDKEYIPAPFLTEDLVKNVKRVLKPDGVVTVNTFRNTKFSKIESELYNKIYGTFFQITNDVSKVIIAKKGLLPSLSTIKAKSSEWVFAFYRIGIDTNWLREKFGQPR